MLGGVHYIWWPSVSQVVNLCLLRKNLLNLEPLYRILAMLLQVVSHPW